MTATNLNIKGLDKIGTPEELAALAAVKAQYENQIQTKIRWAMLILKRGGNLHPRVWTKRQKAARAKAIRGRKVDRKRRNSG